MDWLFLTILLAAVARGLFWLGQELRGWGRAPRPGWEFSLPRPIMVAHRGGGGVYPENTMEAFLGSAQRFGCRFMELDVRVTRDGVPVVIHDETVERSTNGTGPVCELTLAELQSLAVRRHRPAADAPEIVAPAEAPRVPALEEVLRALPECWFSVDVKQHDPPCEAAVVAVIRRCGMIHRCLVGSSDHALHLRLRKQEPALLSFFSRRSIALFTCFVWLGVARWYRPPHHTLQVPERYRGIPIATPRLFRNARKLGLPVLVWTINDAAHMRRLLEMGADGIITSRPDRALKLFQEMGTDAADGFQQPG